MSEAHKFTLAESLEARTALIKEFSLMLGIAWEDVRDVYGDDEAGHNIFWDDTNNPTRKAKVVATFLVERLLWSRDYGLILDYDPTAITKNSPFASQIFFSRCRIC